MTGEIPVALAEARLQRREHLHELVTDFQFIEEALKRCLGAAFDLIRLRTRKELDCRLDREHIHKYGLGRLIDEFELYVGRTGVATALRVLVTDRNHCARQAYRQVLREEAENNIDELLAETKRLAEIRVRVRAAGNALVQEVSVLDTLVRTERERAARADA